MKHSVNWRLLCVGVGLSCWAAPQQTICTRQGGEVVCGEGIQKTVNGSGVVRISKTKVEDKLAVKGRALITDAEIHHLKVCGEAMIRNSQVSGASTIAGVLTCHGTIFGQTVEISTDYLRAERSKFTDIIVKTDSTNGCIYLLEKTSIGGNIVFKGMPGKVIISPDSEVKGRIINGTRA